MEKWKKIKGYGGKYWVSSHGRVKRAEGRWSNAKQNRHFKELILNGSADGLAYPSVGLTKNGKQQNYRIHRLVAIAFIPNPENKRTVNHKDGNRSNNNKRNLEWNTYSENGKHAWDTGLQPKRIPKEAIKKSADLRRGKANPRQSKFMTEKWKDPEFRKKMERRRASR